MRPTINMLHIGTNYRAPAMPTLRTDRGLKSGKLDQYVLTEDDLIRLLADAAECLKIMRGFR